MALETVETIRRIELAESGAEIYTAEQRARVWLAQAQQEPQCLEAVIRWAAERHLEPAQDGRHSFEQLTLARLLIAQRQAALPGQAQLDLHPLLRSLDKQLPPARETGNVWWEIELFLLQALAWQAEGSQDRALAALGRALELAEPGGFVRLFVDEGAPMAALLRQLKTQEHKVPLAYLNKLLEALGLAVGGTPTTVFSNSLLSEPLTPREIEILQRLAHGASSQQIAREMFITLNTVKRHLTHIYGKLGVSNRTQATIRARELGLNK